MSALIPRAEIDAIMARYGVVLPLDGGVDPTPAWVYATATRLRNDALRLRAEADDLDALADRYEREARQ